MTVLHKARALLPSLLAGVAALVPYGCGDGTGLGTEKPVASITVTPPTSTITPGGSAQLQAITNDAEGATLTGRTITWSSSDNGVATVSATGLVTGAAIGISTITAASEGKSGTAEVTVQTQPIVASVSIEPKTVALAPSEAVQLTVTIRDGAGNVLTDRAVAWSSSNTAVASVTAAGLVTGMAVGTATVTATSEQQSGSTAISVATAALEFIAVSAGFGHTCGVATSGKAYCWGRNLPDPDGQDQSGDQLGDGSTRSSSVPVAVLGGLTFSSVSPGMDHTCGLTTTGSTYCWGSHDFRQLGNGSSIISSPVPLAVSGGLTFARVSAGGTHTCGVTTSRAAYCWGANGNGRLGDGFNDDHSAPFAVTGGLEFTQVIATGVSYPAGHTCGLASDGAVYCWGGNEWGQLGDGSTDDQSAPVAVMGTRTFSAVAAGVGHTCGLLTSGAAYCWGANGHGQLGDGSNRYTSVPVPVAGALTFSGLASGALHTCGITANGAAYCWGENDYGQLGNDSNAPSSIPVPVIGGLTFSALTGGGYHTCGLATSGSLYCWGRNDFGQLGDGTTISSLVPVRVAGQ